jgi:ketosteroid isomerase-like protein
MSEENVEVVRRMYNAFHGGDIDGALSHFDPKCWSTPPMPDPTTLPAARGTSA